jgi:hypothetical protein
LAALSAQQVIRNRYQYFYFLVTSIEMHAWSYFILDVNIKF